jgi:hypothetical protein
VLQGDNEKEIAASGVVLFILTYCGAVSTGGPDTSEPCHWLTDLTFMLSLSPMAASIKTAIMSEPRGRAHWRGAGAVEGASWKRHGSVTLGVVVVFGQSKAEGRQDRTAGHVRW